MVCPPIELNSISFGKVISCEQKVCVVKLAWHEFVPKFELWTSDAQPGSSDQPGP